MSKIYFLGPEGSNTHFATQKFNSFTNLNYDLVSVHNILQGFSEYSSENKPSLLVLPLENSIEGTVRETIDNLILQKNNELKIVAEITIAIEHCFVGNKNTDLNNVKTVISHPQAISQCIGTIYKCFGNDVRIINSTSTSKAVKTLDSSDFTTVAIANSLCAQIYGKEVLKTHISEVLNNKTRFVVIDKFMHSFNGFNPSKISLTFSTKNISGALASVLDVFAKYDINLSHIDSRPSKLELGEYVFYCELDASFKNEKLNIAISEIEKFANFIKINGEYFSL